MADAFWATPDELDKLAVDKFSSAPPVASQLEVPDPEPRVLERVQEILDGLNRGDAFSTQTDKPAEPEVSEEQRLRFLAHIMSNAPYRTTQSLMSGRMSVTFETVSAETEQYLTGTVLGEETTGRGTAADRDARYTNYLLFCSLRQVVINGAVGTIRALPLDQGLRERHSLWMSSLNREQYRLILNCFNTFEQQVQTLLAKANDPSFWPTR